MASYSSRRLTNAAPVLNRSISPAPRDGRSSTSFFRSSSMTRVNLLGDPVTTNSSTVARKRTCMCSPTTHPGSFRCSLHKGMTSDRRKEAASSSTSTSNRMSMRRSAMTEAVVRIGTVEGEMVRRMLAALIRPTSHQQKRRAEFQVKPSRLSIMSGA